MEQVKSTGCCPPFDPTPWQEKEITWTFKPFVKDHVIQFFHIRQNSNCPEIGREFLQTMLDRFLQILVHHAKV